MIEAFGVSEAGCVRPNNEDYYVIEPHLGLYLVADGMGGAQAGEHASKLAADTVTNCIKTREDTADQALLKAFEEANRRVRSAASGDATLEGMGTTLVAALEDGDDLIVASVGDSRAYIFDNEQLLVITEDQTWVNEVGRKLGLDDASLKSHPMRHVLTMAIGVSSQLRIHSYRLHPENGMQLLLSSDGLHGIVPESAIIEVLSSTKSLEAKCQDLVQSARKAGGPDNITAVLLRAAR